MKELAMPSGFIHKEPKIKTVLLGITAFILTTIVLSTGGYVTVQAKEIKDKINNLSFSHDGKKILFDRCREEVCQIQVYDLATGALSAYQSPPNERWTMARYSYDGKKIVFSVIPMGEEYLDLGNMQIAVMDPDGKNMRKITTGPGAKIYPMFSHSGKKVLYVKAGRIRKQGRTPASEYDAWEVDIKTGQETRLTYFKFFTMRSLNYFPDDEKFIFEAAQPMAFPGLSLPEDDFNKAMKMVNEERGKHKLYSLAVTTMKRGDMLPHQTYTFAKDIYPKNPLLSNDGRRLLFERQGGQYYLYSSEGNHRLVGGGGSVNSAAISPDGELLGVNYDTMINIYNVKDGKLQVQLFLLAAMNIANWDDDIRKYPRNQKMIPELPSHMIN
jgi:WD40 repeat protein